MATLNQFVQQHLWALQTFGVIFLTTLAHAIANRVIKRLTKKAEHTHFIYDDAFMRAIKSPSVFLIWLFGLSTALGFGTVYSSKWTLFLYVPYVKKLGFVLAFAWFIIKFIHSLEALYLKKRLENNQPVDKTLIHALSQLFTISVSITSLLIALQICGFPISGLLAFGGLGGAAIAFAAKDLLVNFFGSLIVYLDRPFKVGDTISSPDKQIEGTVELIGWRVTCLRTPNKTTLYVPNGLFLTISVENLSRISNRRIKATIGISYEDVDKVDAITTQVKRILSEHPEVDKTEPYFANVVGFGESSLNIMVSAFTKSTDGNKFHVTQHDIFLKILRIISANKASCASPVQTLLVQKEALLT